MQTILYGEPIKKELEDDLTRQIEGLRSRGVTPCIATFRIGDRDSDIYYENSIAKRSVKYGIEHKRIAMPEGAGMDDYEESLIALNHDPGVHGILMLMPFPKGVDEGRMTSLLNPDKDIDAITENSYIAPFSGERDAFHACTASACIRIIKHYTGDMAGKKVTVVGRSVRVGKPVALMATNENATVTICHTKTRPEDLKSACRNADIVILATGQTESFGPDMFSDGQVIIDAGIGTGRDGKIAGDLDAEAIVNSDLNDIKYTPVPGGVGAVTTTQLMRNLIKAVDMELAGR